MSKVERFEDIVAWQKARLLARDVYLMSESRTFSRDYVLKRQIQSAALSVTSNIAEGFERYGPKEFRHFLSIARGSCGELRSQMYLAHDVGYITEATLVAKLEQAREVSRLIGAFRASIR